MPSSLEIQCSTILYAAISAEFGLVIKTNNPYKARASLYKTRRAIGDTELAKLQIRVSPNNSEGEIWLLRQDVAASVNIQELNDAQNNR